MNYTWTMHNVSGLAIQLVCVDGSGAESTFWFQPQDKICGLNDSAKWKMAYLERQGWVVFKKVYSHKKNTNWMAEGF